MARLPRYAAPGMPQHVIQRGNNRSAVFVSESDYRFYLDCLQAACERYGCRAHAYVLMTNHVHLLMTPADGAAISRVMQAVGRRYVQRFNDTHERSGTLWEGRFRATLVETEQYLFACYRYIELNPVRAGLASHPGDYRWSSHRANALGVEDPVVAPHDQYCALGADVRARRVAYRALFATALADSTVAAIRDATNRGCVLGTKRFRDEIAARLERRTQPLWVGRRSGRQSDTGLATIDVATSPPDLRSNASS